MATKTGTQQRLEKEARKNRDVQPAVFSISGGAKYCGISNSNMRAKIRDGTGPVTIRIGARRLIRKEDADAWLASLVPDTDGKQAAPQQEARPEA